MENGIDTTSSHYKGEFASIYEVNQQFPSGGVAGDYVVIDGWAHYWNADRSTWCVNAQRDSYWDELLTNIIERFKNIKGSTYMGVATTGTVPDNTNTKKYYFALAAGKYVNFGNIEVPAGISVLMSDDGTSWKLQNLVTVSQELGNNTTMLVSQKVVTTELAKKFNIADIVQATGTATNKVMSQKAETDALATKVAKTDIVQATGTATDKLMSQKAVTDMVVQETGTATAKVMSQKAVTDMVVQATGAATNKVMSQKAETDALATKVAKTDIVQATGTATDKLMSQKAVTDMVVQETGTATAKVMSQKAVTDMVVQSIVKTGTNDNKKVLSLSALGEELRLSLKAIPQLVLHGGVIEIFPISKSEDGLKFLKSGTWKVRVTKAVQFTYGKFYKYNSVYQPYPGPYLHNSTSKAINKISTGEWEFELNYDATDETDNTRMLGLYYNIKTEKFHWGSYEERYDWLVIACQDIYNPHYITYGQYAGWVCLRTINTYSTTADTTEPTLYCEQIRPGVIDRIVVTDILPDDFSNIDVSNWLTSCCREVHHWYFPKGEYKISETLCPSAYYNEQGSWLIEGEGQDVTIFRRWNFTNNKESAATYMNYFSACTYKKCTIYNCGFGQYGGSGKTIPNFWKMEDVDIRFTLPVTGGYIFMVAATNFTLDLKRVRILVEPYNNSYGVYAGIYVDKKSNVYIEDCSVVGCNKPILLQGPNKAIIRNTTVKYGTTGIFFGGNKTCPIETAIIENCIVEGVNEESISFDTYGNNVGLCTLIAELSVSKAEVITLSTYPRNNVLKMHCKARNLTGSHPNEKYQAYPNKFTDDKEYLEQFYVYFSEYAGETFDSCIAKIIEVGEDDEGEYVVINTSLDPSKLELKEKEDLDDSSADNNYRVCGIIGGFHNCVIRNCTVRDAKSTPIAMYCSCFNCIIDGCKMQNCGSGMYIFAAYMLAKPTYQGSVNNKVINCTFERCGTSSNGIGLSVNKNYGLSPKNTLVANNFFIDSKFETNNTTGTYLANNSFVGDAGISMNDKASTTSIGYVYPSTVIPGQHFFDLNTNKEMIYNGTEWVEV